MNYEQWTFCGHVEYFVHKFPLEMRAYKHGIIMQYNILENNNILINTAHTVHCASGSLRLLLYYSIAHNRDQTEQKINSHSLSC